jgi:hypothetical protein
MGRPGAASRCKARSLEQPRAAAITARRALSEDLGFLPEGTPATHCTRAEPARAGAWEDGCLDLLLLLGRGSFGAVYLGMYRSGAEGPKFQVAVKVTPNEASLKAAPACEKMRRVSGNSSTHAACMAAHAGLS